jgi:hypothetical protein
MILVCAADQQDVTFEELMKQYRDYERQQGVTGTGGDYDDDDEEEDAQEEYSHDRVDSQPRKHVQGDEAPQPDRSNEMPAISRKDVLQSRAGRDLWKKGSQARMPTADVDRRTELREVKTPGPAGAGPGAGAGGPSSAPQSPWSKRHDEDDAGGASRQQSRQGTGWSGRPSTRASSIADRGRLDDEMMGDALYYGILFYAMLCYSILCYAMLCYACATRRM